MSGCLSRNKGRRGEREAVDLLTERGWEVIELGPGRLAEDVVATDPRGTTHAVEVKHHVVWRLADWRKQAKEQAKRRRHPWLLMCRVPNMPGCFYVEGAEVKPVVWRGNAARECEA